MSDSVRLIPESGPDPEWRDEVNAAAADRFEQSVAEARRLRDLIECEGKGEYRDTLIRAHKAAIKEAKAAAKDLEVGIRAALCPKKKK